MRAVKTPPFVSSYLREFLGWLQEDTYPKSAYGEYWINSLETTNYGDSIFRYNLEDNTNETTQKYYILEARNRTLKTWDSSLPEGKALILYKIDTMGYPEYGYAVDGFMNKQHQKISIPAIGGVLTPNGDSHLDMANLVYISALSDEQMGDTYRIKSKIEKIDYNFFADKLKGEILNSQHQFYLNVLPYVSMQNSAKNSYSENQLALAHINPKTGKSELGLSMRPLTKQEMIQDTLEKLIPIFLLISLLIWLNKKIAPRLNSERNKKLITIIIKIFLIISTLAFIGFLLMLTAIFIFASEKAEPKPRLSKPGELLTPLLSTVVPDTDLHAITPDGLHVGVNYDTGEYETQIAGAIYSGDNSNSPEWIFVPEGVEVSYYVSARDNQIFLEENPGIAAQMTDTTDSYEIYARYIDPQTNIYTSEILTSQSISPNENIVHEITGTTTITVNPGVVDSVPPVTTISLSGTQGNSGYYTSDVEITLSASDDGSGVAKTEYSLDNGVVWTEYVTPFIDNIEGTNSILYRSTDRAGNIEVTKTEIIKLDQTPPTIFASDTSAEQLTEAGTQLTISATTEDNVDANPTLTSDIPLTQVFPAGVTDILLTATDQAGNTATSSIAVTIFFTPAADPDGDGIPNQDDVKPFDPAVFANITLANEYSYWAKEDFNYPFSVAGVGTVKVSFSKIYYELKAEQPLVDDAGNIIPTTITTVDGIITLSFVQATKDNTNYVLRIKTKKGNKKEKEKIKEKKDEEENAEKKDELEKELKFVEAPITVSITAINTLEESSAVTIYDKKKKASIHYKYKDENGQKDAQLILKTDEEIELTRGAPMVFTVKVTGIPKSTSFTANLTGNFTLIDIVDEEEHKDDKHRKQKKFSFFYPVGYNDTQDTITIDVVVDGVARSDVFVVEFKD